MIVYLASLILIAVFMFLGIIRLQWLTKELSEDIKNLERTIDNFKPINVIKEKEESKQGSGYKRTHYRYVTDSGEIVGITIWRYRHTSSAEWRSSDEKIILNIGMVPLDPIRINNKTWIRFANFQIDEYLVFGYFKRIDWNLVAVYRVIKNEKHKDEIESYKKTRVLSDQLKSFITGAFEDSEELFVIE